MEVIVDGADNFRIEGNPEDALAVVRAADRFLRGQQRAMVGLVADGVRIAPEKLVEALGGRPVSAIARIEIRSDSISAMVAACLGELQSAVPELPAACHSLSEVFHGERPEEGYEPFNELARIWGHIKDRERMVLGALDLASDALTLDGQALPALHDELNGVLEQAAHALEQGDLILLGDLLEYELAPRAEREARIVALLQEQAAARAQ